MGAAFERGGDPPTVRRLKATIIGDLVGFSRLVEQDESGTIDRLAALKRDRIQPALDHFGAWMRWSAGDQFIALFDSVVEAVECACRIQRTLEDANEGVPEDKQVRMRIGINLGDVIYEEEDVAGESVNIAARLEGLCEPGGLAISESAYREVHHKLPLAYKDLGLRSLKNLAEPVRVYGVHAKDVLSADQSVRRPRLPLPERRRWAQRPFWVLIVILSVLAGAGLVLVLGQDAVRNLLDARGGPGANTIAVLPFENLSNDPTQDHVARGIATDLIVDLSGIETASVVARRSSFHYAERPIDLKDMAALLGAKYVVDGTVLLLAGNIRVNVSLIDAQSERQLWAERFEGPTAELFRFQQTITEELLEELEIEIAEADRPLRRTRAEFEVTDMFYAAREAYYKDDPDNLASARRLFDQILQADPEFSDAHAYLAAIYWAGFDNDWARKLDLDEQQSLDLAWHNMTMSLKSPLPLTYQVQAQILAWEGDYEGAEEAAMKAIQLDSNDPESRLTVAIVLIYRGQMEPALDYLERASDVDPLNLADYLFWNGLAHYLLGNHSDAARLLRDSTEINPNNDWAHLLLAAALGQLGRTEEASRAIETAQRLRRHAGVPAYSLRYVRYWSFEHDEHRFHLCEGLARAGLTGRCERPIP